MNKKNSKWDMVVHMYLEVEAGGLLSSKGQPGLVLETKNSFKTI